jgi:DNA-binding transcriptional LysR family regulator
MELYQLRTFSAVADEGHLTRASERLHISQPAVSGQIKALEQEFDLRLFDRSPAGMALTVAGRELLPLARKLLDDAEAFRRTARRLSGDVSGTLRIGTVSNPDSIRLGALMALAVNRHPRMELELQHEVSGAALEGVREGRLDASFYFGDSPGRDFTTLRLREFVYCVTAPAAWAERIEGADWSDLAALPWILTPAISTHNRLVTRLFEQQGVEPPQRHVEADQESVIESLVVSGVGLALMQEESARARAAAGQISIWPKARLRTTLWFVCAAGREADPSISALFSLLRETWDLTEPAARKPAPARAPALSG